jgi:hypothetical protein
MAEMLKSEYANFVIKTLFLRNKLVKNKEFLIIIE